MFQIFSVEGTNHLLLRNTDDPTHPLTLPDHRDLLLLRNRLNAYVENLCTDGTVEPPPPPAPPKPAIISADQARALAAEQDITVKESTLRMAMVRGIIPHAEKRGSRWWLPRHEFETWLGSYLKRKG